MKNSERAEAVLRVILAIQTLPDGLAVGATDSPLHPNLYVGSSADLKALVADHERRGEALQSVVDRFLQCKVPDDCPVCVARRALGIPFASEAMKGG